MIGRPEWKTDPRCKTLFDRRRHTEELTREIERCLPRTTARTGRNALDEHGLIWAPSPRFRT
jgi:crotonobetainyl-CoA:carnitine CoA-transferase CaiB-like acyl-CoA transferase